MNALKRMLALALTSILLLAFALASGGVSAQPGKEPTKKESKLQACVDGCNKVAATCKLTCTETHKDPRGVGYCQESCSTRNRTCHNDCAKSK